jgi:hypothetical protein
MFDKYASSLLALQNPASLIYFSFILFRLLQLSYNGSTGTVIIVHTTDVKNYQQSIRLTRRHR